MEYRPSAEYKVGFKKLGIRQWVVLAAFVVFSVGGQLIPKMAAADHDHVF